jgi:hypothetical protein
VIFFSLANNLKAQLAATSGTMDKYASSLEEASALNGKLDRALMNLNIAFLKVTEPVVEFINKLSEGGQNIDKLVQTASWLAQGLILKNIQSNCKYSIRPNLEEGIKNLSGYLKNYSPIPGVYVNGKLDNFEFNKIQLTNQAIVAFLTINGEINITVDGFK